VQSGQAEQHTLRADALSLVNDWVASVANVAPTSTVAFTLALLVGFAGLQAPLAVLGVGILMTFCAVGYARLNAWQPHAGSPYIWVGHSVSPWLGYATGILAILAATVANIGNITLFGTYLLGIINPTGTFDNIVVWVVSAAMMGIVIYIAIRGIRPSIRFQTAIIVFEYAIVIVFVLLALKREFIDAAVGTTAPSASAFTIGPAGFGGLVSAAVICGFLYAGWEAPLVLGEESKAPHYNPGRAAILGMAFLTLWYTFLILVFQGVASPADIASNGTDILKFAGGLLLGDPAGRLLAVAVLSAVFATTQMQLTESSRVVFAMARERLLPEGLARVHPRFRTPIFAGLALGIIPPLALIPYLWSQGARTAIGYVISADGLLYLAMYAVITLACVWYYRRILSTGTRELFLHGIIPLVGGVAMAAIFLYGLYTQPFEVQVVAGGLVVACLVVAVIARIVSTSPYFQHEAVAHEVK
jgi:amino acid transporter